jgi:hypothetical protein
MDESGDQVDRDLVELGHIGNADPSNWSDFDWLMRIRIADVQRPLQLRGRG